MLNRKKKKRKKSQKRKIIKKMLNCWGVCVFLNQILLFQDRTKTSAIKSDQSTDQSHNK